MKRVKSIIAILLSVMMTLSMTVMEKSSIKEVRADNVFVVTSPANGSLKAAGHLDITWSDASAQGTVKNYKLYVDGKLETTTTGLSYEIYTTKVNYHIACVQAEFTDGKTIVTPVVRFGITKKGLAVNAQMGSRLYPDRMNMGWYYNWGTSPFGSSTYKAIEYVPMIWGTGNESSISSVAKANYKYLLAYNEPDMGNNVGGSNINVNTAMNHWNKFLGNNYYLGAPAPALSPSWNSGTWFRTFMNGIDQSTVDFIPLHCYYDKYSGAAGANAFLTEVVDGTYNMYHKPIWITEFAVSGFGYSNTWARNSVEEFMKTAIDGLNQRDYVVRYSWFSFDTTDESNGASALWTNSNGKLTQLGNTYVNYGNPTTDYNPNAFVPVGNNNESNNNSNNNNNNNSSNGNTSDSGSVVTKLEKVKIKSAKNIKGKKIKITLRKIKKVSGYQIRWSDNKKMRGYWNKNVGKASYTLKKLKKKERYYIKARAYVKNNGKKTYGPWSKIKKVKVVK